MAEYVIAASRRGGEDLSGPDMPGVPPGVIVLRHLRQVEGLLIHSRDRLFFSPPTQDCEAGDWLNWMDLQAAVMNSLRRSGGAY